MVILWWLTPEVGDPRQRIFSFQGSASGQSFPQRLNPGGTRLGVCQCEDRLMSYLYIYFIYYIIQLYIYIYIYTYKNTHAYYMHKKRITFVVFGSFSHICNSYKITLAWTVASISLRFKAFQQKFHARELTLEAGDPGRKP